MLKTVSVQAEYVMPQAAANFEDIVGAMTTTKIYNGEQIMRGRVTRGDTPATFAYSIPDGKRALTFALDPISGVAGFIQPHDQIDIILSLTPPGAGDAGGQNTQSSDQSLKVFQDIAKKLLSGRRFVTFNGSLATFTLYQNIEVLAVGKRVTRPDTDAPNNEGNDQGTEGTLTLCLDPEQVEMMTNAEKVGTLKYDLRNPGDDGIAELKPIIEYKPK
jgi:pilus assembly protein CpaB